MLKFSNTHLIVKSQSGFSLIEVLVSLLILGIGLLGLGGLQVASIKSTSNAHSRNVANMVAMDFADRMRANPLGVAGGHYSNSVTCTNSVKQCRRSTFCTPEEVAIFDLNETICGMKRGSRPKEGGLIKLLPNPTFLITCPGGCDKPKALHQVTITWGDSNIHQQQSGDFQTQSITVPIIP